MNDLVRWALTALFGLPGCWIIALNYHAFFLHFTGRRSPSWIPLLGAFMAMFAMLVCPLPAVQKRLWLPLILDPGCLPGILYSFASLIYASVRRDAPPREPPASELDQREA